MNYEKAYKETIDKLRKLHNDWDSTQNRAAKEIESVFPELRESEDEKVRKEIYRYFRDLQLSSDREFSPSISIDEILAWLEKQGEQKPIDMIEPKFKPGDKIVEKDIDECGSGTIKEIRDGKYIFEDNCFIYIKEQDLWQLVKEPVELKFKVGDWVVNKLGHVWHIDSFDKKNYQVSNGDKYNYFPISKQNEMHLWTIQDAEDGDMLAEHETIVLFKKIEGQNIRCYCTYHYLGFNPTFYVGTLQNKNPYCPATKEQRDLLLRKMKETGYEWDAEKKELRIIEHKSLSTEETELNSLAFLTELGYTCTPPTKEKHSEWSEDDEEMIDFMIEFIESLCWRKDLTQRKDNVLSWLKSLKPQPKQEWSKEDSERLARIHQFIWANRKGDTDEIYQLEQDADWLMKLKPQLKQEWSEEDEKIINDAIWLIEHYATDGHKKLLREQTIDKLKSLKPNHWKPSEEQMEIIENLLACEMPLRHKKIFESLYNDLKKL